MVLVAGGIDTIPASRERRTVRPGERDLDCHRQPQHRTRIHTATLLQNGKVLVAGGLTTSWHSASAELYDPASGTWTATGSLNTARSYHTATLLPNGKVLVAGGFDSTASPRAPNCTTRRAGLGLPQAASTPHALSHTATLLQNGKVLVAGGLDNSRLSRERRTVRPGERDLDCHRQPQHRTLLSHGDVAPKRQGPCCRGTDSPAFSRAPNCTTRRAGPGLPREPQHRTRFLTRRRCYKTARSLLQGDLIASALLASAELYDPASGTWTATGSLNTARYFHTATLLQNGMVLVAGGLGTNTMSGERGTGTPSPLKIHWDGSKKRPSRSLNQRCLSRNNCRREAEGN